MPEASWVRTADVRSLLDLLHEARETPLQSQSRHRVVLKGICRLLHADVAHISWDRPHPRDRRHPQALSFAQEGLEAGEQALAWEYLTAPDPPDSPMDEGISQRLHQPDVMPGQTLVLQREQLVDDYTWYRSRHVNQLCRAMNVDHRLGALYVAQPMRHGQGLSHDLFLHRRRGDSPFNPRDRALLNLFWSQASRLFPLPQQPEQPPPPPVELSGYVDTIAYAVGGLPPRLRQVLAGLLEGDDAQQLAHRLNLSRHTIYDHIRRLYQRLGIHDRNQLAGRCLQLLDQHRIERS